LEDFLFERFRQFIIPIIISDGIAETSMVARIISGISILPLKFSLKIPYKNGGRTRIPANKPRMFLKDFSVFFDTLVAIVIPIIDPIRIPVIAPKAPHDSYPLVPKTESIGAQQP